MNFLVRGFILQYFCSKTFCLRITPGEFAIVWKVVMSDFSGQRFFLEYFCSRNCGLRICQ